MPDDTTASDANHLPEPGNVVGHGRDATPCTVHHRYMFYYVMRGGEMIEKFVWEEDAVKLAAKLNEAATKPWVKV